MALTLSCAGSALLSSAYFVVWLTRRNDPGMTVSPIMDAGLTGGLNKCETIDIDKWIDSSTPSASNGVWNPTTTYASGNTVESAAYRMISDDGSLNIPIVYKSRTNGNKGNSPEAFDGHWTCMTTPVGANPGQNFPVVPFAYALNPLPTKSDLASGGWGNTLWHSLFSTVSPPGDVVQLIDLYVRLNYLLGSSIVPTISRPLTQTNTNGPGLSGLIVNPGINAQFQCWHTSGLANFPSLTLNGFDQSAYISGFQPGATTGSAYLSSLVASGGSPPYIYAIIAGSLPPGVTLNGSTGVISGTPTSSGIFNFTAQVTDSTGATATTSCAAPMQCGSGSGGSGVKAGNAFY